MNLNEKIMTINYTDYITLVARLVEENKTTGSDQSEKLVEFTKLNQQRMNRLNKTIRLSDEQLELLKKLNTPKKILVIGEAWCGDCAQIIPVLNKIVEASNNQLSLEIISREESPELIEKYGTNGIISIPKLLIYEDEKLTQTWGSRPKPAVDILNKWKANLDTMTHDDFEKELHLWYAKDKGKSIIDEVLSLIVTS
jgi:thiol-disulfide isomerase/thioredoxin